MLNIQHFTKTYGEKRAVDDLSLHIAPGEIYGFIGHNGAGKTTTLKAAVGIPLVLHGGSSNPDAELARAVSLGINKINISSDIKVAYHDKMREVLADLGMREPNATHSAIVSAV